MAPPPETEAKRSTALPVLGASSSSPSTAIGSGKIVDFAAVYRRSRDDEALESLRDLSQELEQVARQHRKKLASRHSAGDDAPGTAGGAAAAGAVRVYAPDQLQLLLSTQDSGADAAATREHLLHHHRHPPRSADAKGKPMRRFMASSVSPFASALANAEQAARLRHAEADASPSEAHDELYNKVQQIPWEEHIDWGIEFARPEAEKEEEEEDVVDVVEVENAAGETTTVRTPRAGYARAESKSRSENTGKLSSSNLKAGVKQSEPSTDGMLPSKEMKPCSTGIIGISVPFAAPTKSDGADFDVTKPRHYRWELADDIESGGSTHKHLETAQRSKNQNKPSALLAWPVNKELESGLWTDAIGWHSTKDMPESKLIIDANDTALVESLTGGRVDAPPVLRIPERKLTAEGKRCAQRELDLANKRVRIENATRGIEFGEDAVKTRRGTGKRGKKSTIAIDSYPHHSLPAVKLSLTRLERSMEKRSKFHRPRGKFKINERMRLCSPPSNTRQTDPAVTQITKSKDLFPTTGGKLILVEYSEQNPLVLSNAGMASRMLHYRRAPKPQCDGNARMFKAKEAQPPDVAMGQVVVLGDQDESPFVGDVPPGRTVTIMSSKLSNVPIFPHKPVAPFTNGPPRDSISSELFLFCRPVSKSMDTSVGAKSTTFLMELPQVFTAGQVEPQIEAPVPNSRRANEFIRPYMSFHILRMFKKAHNGGRLKIEDVARAFPSESNTAVRKRLKEVATFERGGGDSGWWERKPASQLMSEDDLRADISPESVCLYESKMAGLRRLRDIGLVKVCNPADINGAVDTLVERLEFRKQNLSAKLIEPLGLERRAKEKAEEELWKKDAVIRKLETDIQVARYINEQLQLTPWNLINNYVECHLQGKGSGMLQLGGIGDPTGRGEGFSFVRVPQSRTKRRSGEEDVSRGPSSAELSHRNTTASITGTTADLRKLKMKEIGAVLRNLGVDASKVNTLHRWDRIQLLRELSTRAYNVGAAGVLSRFVRESRKSLSAQQQEYRKKCDVIYERQMNVLSNPTTTFSSDEEDEDDDDMDFDEWEKDLEADILGGTDTKRGPKNLFTKGGSGLNRSKEVLAEREDAVELRRLMQEMKEDSGSSAAASRRPDVNASQLRNQLRASGIVDSASSRSAPSSRPGGILASRGDSTVSSAIATPTDHLSRASSPTHGRSPSGTPNLMGALGDGAASAGGRVPGRKVLKRTVRFIEENGTENVRIEFIVDDRQVARFRAMQQRKDRQQKAEELSQLRKRKAVSPCDDDSIVANNAKMQKLG